MSSLILYNSGARSNYSFGTITFETTGACGGSSSQCLANVSRFVFGFFGFIFNLPLHIPCRHPRWKRAEAGHGLHPRRILHGRNWQHDWRQHPGQLWECHRHHHQLPAGSFGWVHQFISPEAANWVCEWNIEFAIDLTANWFPSLQWLAAVRVGRELLVLIFNLTLTEVDSGCLF